MGISRSSVGGALKPVWSAQLEWRSGATRSVSTVRERDCIVGRGPKLSDLHPFASGGGDVTRYLGCDVSCGETSESGERAFMG